MNDKNMGAYIKKLREEREITQEELANELNITRQAVSSWERGKSLPDIDMVKLLADYFNVSVSEIMYGEVKKISNQIQLNKTKFIVVIPLLLIVITLLSTLTIRLFTETDDNITTQSDNTNNNEIKYSKYNRPEGITLESADFNNLSNEDIYLRDFRDKTLEVFYKNLEREGEEYDIYLQDTDPTNIFIYNLESDDLLTYDFTVGYRIWKFGEWVEIYHTIGESNNVINYEENYISLMLYNLNQDSRDTDSWFIVEGLQLKGGGSYSSFFDQFEDFPKDYVSKGSVTPKIIDVEPGKVLTLISYYYSTEDSCEVVEVNGEITNKEEIDFIISWYIIFDNIYLIN